MTAGRLNCRVTIRQLVDGQDALGQPQATWSDLATVWADIRHPSGTESIKAGADVSTVKASIRIRRRADVAAAMRVVYSGAVYDIKAVLPDKQRVYVNLVCELAA